LNSYYQTFVNAVRATGGNNSSRWLVLSGPNTNIDLTNSLMNTLPNDPTEDRLAVEVHYYDPWQFAGLEADANWGDMFYFWGDDYNSSTLASRNATHSEENHLVAQLQKMNTKFVRQGVPVILGEFGAMNRTGNSQLSGTNLDLHLASRLYYHQLIVDTANSMGISPIYWDNGWTGQNGSGIFNRSTAGVFDPGTVSALTGGPGQPGDFDDDGDVDGRDFLEWQRGNSPNPQSADDLADWQTNYGIVPELLAGIAIPEPTCAAITTLLTLFAVASRFPQRQKILPE
jgi:endoglucanase